jgi:hypothetical protein
MYWASTGSGACAGFTYHGFWHFMDPRSLKPGDRLVWTGRIGPAK